MAPPSDTDMALNFPILIGDIGGTNARFAILVDSHAEPKQFDSLMTADFATIGDAIQAAILDHTSILPRSAVLAVAGPVSGDEIDLTNCDWVVRPRELMHTFRLDDIIVLNDFEAQALAVAELGPDHMSLIGGGEAEPNASKVVLGPGTGLGVACLVHARHAWIPVAGEGGHVDLGPRTARELAIFAHLEKIEGRISGEQILCGRGLVNLYRAIAAADSATPKFSTPAAITTAGLEHSDPVCEETLELFVTFLGRLAGDLALVTMGRGGVYLSGGIVQKILPALESGAFRRAFQDKAPHSALIAQIPVFVITHPRAAVMGLAAFARTPARFEVALEGRRWTDDSA